MSTVDLPAGVPAHLPADLPHADVGDPTTAVRARGALAAANRAGVLTTADVHVARRLGRLVGERDERVLLAVALAVRGLRSGSVCVRLEDAAELAGAEAETDTGVPTQTRAPGGPVEGAVPLLEWPEVGAWGAALEASPLVSVGVDGPADRPLRWVAGRLYLDRYWRDEQVVRQEVDRRLAAPAFEVDHRALVAAVRRHLPDAERRHAPPGMPPVFDNARQRLAAVTATLSRFTVLTGGPGTGKTTTVAKLLAVLHEVASADGAPARGLRVALAAPTGKAAARLQEAVAEAVARMPVDDRARVGSPEATTIHRLLGWHPASSTRFRHDRDNRLPHDVVVVDETSMVSLPLMARLLEALRPQARLVLVGDPDQLSSVEAGAVLGDLVRRPAAAAGPVAGLAGRLHDLLPGDVPDDPADRAAMGAGVVRLTEAYRYGAELGRLAEAIRRGEADAVVRALRAGGTTVEWVEVGDVLTDDDVAGVRADVEDAGRELTVAAVEGDVPRALRALGAHRLLLAHRRGPAGVARWSGLAEAWVAAVAPPSDAPPRSAWPPGTPLLVTTNDRDTGLYNGDTGVVVTNPSGGLAVAFEGTAGRRPDGTPEPRLVRPHRLPAVQPVHAMTVHRGQGSQFARVSVLLPPESSSLLTRELLYTAVTRARQHVRVVGSEAAVRAAVGREVRRASGLQHAT